MISFRGYNVSLFGDGVTTSIHMWDPWRNGSAFDSRSEGCVFDSCRVHFYIPRYCVVIGMVLVLLFCKIKYLSTRAKCGDKNVCTRDT